MKVTSFYSDELEAYLVEIIYFLVQKMLACVNVTMFMLW